MCHRISRRQIKKKTCKVVLGAAGGCRLPLVIKRLLVSLLLVSITIRHSSSPQNPCSPMSLISGLGGSSRERSWFCRSTAVPGSRRRSTPRARGRCGADPPRPSQLARGRSAVHNQSFLSRSAGPHARLKGFRAEDCATTTTTTTAERETKTGSLVERTQIGP